MSTLQKQCNNSNCAKNWHHQNENRFYMLEFGSTGVFENVNQYKQYVIILFDTFLLFSHFNSQNMEIDANKFGKLSEESLKRKERLLQLREKANKSDKDTNSEGVEKLPK